MDKRLKTILKYMFSSIGGMLISSLYIIVDGIFVGRGVSSVGLGAVNLAFPFTGIANSICFMITVGGSTLVANRIGNKENEKANNAFLTAFSLTVAIAVLVMFLGMFFSRQIAILCGANEVFEEMTATYIFYCCTFSLPWITAMALGGFVRNDGSPQLSFYSMLLGSLMNIALDWLFIFPLKMGIAGAAIASGLGQIASLIPLIYHFAKKKGILRFKKFSINFDTVKKIALRGMPDFFAHIGTSTSMIVFNHRLLELFRETGVSAFSVINYILSMSFAVLGGSSQGLQPLIGTTYGSKDEINLKYYTKTGIKLNLIFAVALYALFVLLSKPIISTFNSDPNLIDMACSALPRFCWSFLFMAVNLICVTYFAGTKRTEYATALSISRGILIKCPVILIIPAIFGAQGLWYTEGISELLNVAVALGFIAFSERKGIVFR